jgi:hypothetical protein
MANVYVEARAHARAVPTMTGVVERLRVRGLAAKAHEGLLGQHGQSYSASLLALGCWRGSIHRIPKCICVSPSYLFWVFERRVAYCSTTCRSWTHSVRGNL